MLLHIQVEGDHDIPASAVEGDIQMHLVH